MSGLTGEITWDADTPQGECVVEAYKLFAPSGILEIDSGEQEGQAAKPFKCCTSSVGKPTRIQDMTADPLPAEGAVRMMGDKEGCGYMFGDTYHSAKHEEKCPVPLPKLLDVTGLSLERVMDFLKSPVD
jgi:hypothetical protein